ncbi:Dystonin [Manis javanica]|nr:Dystonin [Manis javanica]
MPRPCPSATPRPSTTPRPCPSTTPRPQPKHHATPLPQRHATPPSHAPYVALRSAPAQPLTCCGFSGCRRRARPLHLLLRPETA